MVIQSFIPKCVAFVGAPRHRASDVRDYLGGTCFILLRSSQYVVPGHLYIVTARHVIRDVGERTGGAVFIRANTARQKAAWMETKQSDWVTGAAEIDVAVLPLTPDTLNFANIHCSMIPAQCLATKESLKANKQVVEIGDELAIPGLFVHHYGAEQNIPIVRMGSVAALAEEKLYAEMGSGWFEKINAYLVEVRSIGGLSGSPVLIHRYESDETADRHSTWGLLGLMQGHYDNPAPATARVSTLHESINTGIGIVITADDISEALSHPDILALEKRVEDGATRRTIKVREVPRSDEV